MACCLFGQRLVQMRECFSSPLPSSNRHCHAHSLRRSSSTVCPNSRIESELTPINDTFGAEESGVDKNRIDHGSWVFQKIPVSWDYFYEHAMSPARLERSHRGSTPNHYNEPEPNDVTVTKKPTKNGFEITFKEKGSNFEFTDKFSAPGLLSTHTPRE